VWFAFGNDLGKYIAQVRAYDAQRAHKTIVFVIVNSVADALRAANDWKVDVLVVQGKGLYYVVVFTFSPMRVQALNLADMVAPRLPRFPSFFRLYSPPSQTVL
jgi:hypothetical protein